MRRCWNALSPKSALRLSLILAGLSGAFPAVSEAAKAGGGTTTTMVLTYVNGVQKWVCRIDPLNVQGFQLDVLFDPARCQLDQAVGTNGVIYKFPFAQGAAAPHFSQLSSGRLQDIAGNTSQTSPGDVDIFELLFIDLQPGASIANVAFTVFASSNDSIVAFDPVTLQPVTFAFNQIAATTRSSTPGVNPHIWDPDTLYNNGTTGGEGTWDTSSNSWDDLPLASPFIDTSWNNTTHAQDIAVFGGNPGSGIVTLAEPISVGGFQFDSSGYHIQGNVITLSAPPGATPVIHAGVNSVAIDSTFGSVISSTISGSSGLTKTGNGTLILTGANNYTGTTFVSAGGTLLVNNPSGSGTGNGLVRVGLNAVLGGTGVINGPVDVISGGPSSATLLAGDGTTASGALTLANDLRVINWSVLKIALGPSGAHSTLTRAGGTWTLDGYIFFIDVGAQPGFYDNIITGLASDPGVASWAMGPGGFAGTFIYDGEGNVDVNITAVQPRPPLQLFWAASRKAHGSAGVFDIYLPPFGDGVECRTGGGNYTLMFGFTNNITSGNASVTGGIGNVAGGPIIDGKIMTVNLNGVTDVQKLTLTLSNVTDAFAQVLPDTAVSVNMLIGDVNGTKTVSNTDVSAVKGQVSSPVTASNFTNDVNVSGTISNTDVSATKAHVSNTLP